MLAIGLVDLAWMGKVMFMPGMPMIFALINMNMLGVAGFNGRTVQLWQ